MVGIEPNKAMEKTQKKQKKSKGLKQKEFKKQLGECQKLNDEYLAGWQRARADFINYKKEEGQKFQELLKYAVESLVLNFLAILDNFEAAEKNLKDERKKEPDIKGFLQIKKQIEDFLKQQGLEEIETKGEKFNPSFHEAIEGIEKKGSEPGEIIEIVQKGYKLNGKVIRPVKVKITK